METARKIEKVREALANGNVRSVEFNRDGSGASFYFIDPTGDHGLPCDRLLSLDIDSAMKVVAGFRFKQHEHQTCF